MREIRLHGSEGGGTELNRSSLPLSPGTLGLLLFRELIPGLFLGAASGCRAAAQVRSALFRPRRAATSQETLAAGREEPPRRRPWRSFSGS